MRRILLAVCLSLALCSHSMAAGPPPPPYQALVVEAHDGDTVKVKTFSGAKKRIRVKCIDTPEAAWLGHWPAQPGSELAQARAAHLIQDKVVTIHPAGAYTYGRELASIELQDGRDLATILVKEGLGWSRCKVNRPDMEKARAAGKGIWKERAIDPSKWRKGER